MLTPVKALNVGPDKNALLEQCVLCGALYNNDLAGARNVISAMGGGLVEALVWSREIVPPDYLIWRQGNDWCLVFDGSVTFTQFLNCVAGSGTGSTTREGGEIHEFVAHVWDDIRDDVMKILPASLNGGKLWISGHSLGGATGFLASYELARKYGALNVYLCTFGAFKIWREAVPQNYSPLSAFIVNHNDPSPYWPSGIPIPGLTIIEKLVSVIAKAVLGTWEQPDAMYQFLQGITLDPRPLMLFKRSPIEWSGYLGFGLLLSLGDLTDHLLAHYYATIKTYVQRFPVTPQSAALILLGDVVFAQPNSKPNAVNPNPRRYINIPEVNNLVFPGNPAQITPQNLHTLSDVQGIAFPVSPGFSGNIALSQGINMTVPSGYYKVTMLFNASDLGRSESHVLKTANGWADAQTKALSLAKKRSFLLGNSNSGGVTLNTQNLASPQIEFVRISDALNPRLSVLLDLSNSLSYFGAELNSNFGADAMSTALSMQIPGLNENDNTTVSHSNLDITGQPDSIVKNRLYDGSIIVSNPKSFNVMFMQYLAELINSARLWGYMGNSVAQVNQPVQAWAVNGGNRWQLTVPAHGYNTGDKVHITRVDQRGFAGTYTVTYVDVNNFTISKQPSTTLPVPQTGKVRRIALANGQRLQDFYRYQTPVVGLLLDQLISIRKKNPGRRFVKQSFKHRARRVG